ncbi:MAG: hypothetical protein U0904_12180 [Candidatus Nanopelagicales bacterium]|nr:hypothetical protein [Candidatus Nanopelagicales bacterium]
MLDFATLSRGDLNAVTNVIETLTDVSALDPAQIMIVGAECRNILHAAQGHAFLLRSTSDLDIGIALPDWVVFNDLAARLTPIRSSSRIRYLVGDIAVDLLPFGDVEEPSGTVTPPRRNSALRVPAFTEVFDRALVLPLPNDRNVRIPSPAGYAALKMYAWVERSLNFDDRDAADLATVTYWYQESAHVRNRLYDTAEGRELLADAELDLVLASAMLLSHDVAHEIGSDRTQELKAAWSQTDLDYLASSFGHETLPGWPSDRRRRKSVVDCLGCAIVA